MTTILPDNAIRVATCSDRIISFLAANSDSISQLYVATQHFRQGVGSLMLARTKKNSSGSLWLHTFERNMVARAFFERHGFQIVERGFEKTWQLADLKYVWNNGLNSASERITLTCGRDGREREREPGISTNQNDYNKR